jgi:hypothetical protein
VYIDGVAGQEPHHEYSISRCITTADGMIPVHNLADAELEIRAGKLVARSYPCLQEPVPSQVSTFCVRTCELSPFRLDDVKDQLGPTLDEEQQANVLQLINEFRDCFAVNTKELGDAHVKDMQIRLQDDIPVSYRPYRLAYAERSVVRGIVQDLLSNGIIRESESPYSSPVLLVKKKSGEYRMCVDYRSLNAKTIKDKYPLPRVDDHLERMHGSQYFTTLDLASGYHQIKVAEESTPKTAFVTPDGHYEYLRVPFGLVNAPAVFQRAINSILDKLRHHTAMAYLDDIILPATTFSVGLSALREVFELFRQAGMTFRLSKCGFFFGQLEYLGHELSSESIRPGQAKTTAIREYPRPTNVHEVRQFIGLTSYFRKFIRGFAALAKPLTTLTKSTVPFKWEADQEESFQTLRQRLAERPVLDLCNQGAVTELHTDASKHGVGGILIQHQSDGSLHPVCYYSRQTTKAEQSYHSYELETQAVVESMRRFRVYLLGTHFTVVTDCNAIRSTLTKKDLVPRIGRWWLLTQEFDFDVVYRPGTKMAHVDALSRNSVQGGESHLDDDLRVLHIDISTDDWVLAAQRKDDRCKQLYAALASEPITDDERAVHADYRLKGGRVYRSTPDGLRWVVPKAARAQIVFYHHDNVGHCGAERTLQLVKRKYWFPSMKKYIGRYVSCCLPCMYNKVPTGKQTVLLHPIPKLDIPMHILHVDHLGPFVPSSLKNAYLITSIDGFTKFAFLKAVRNTKVGPVLYFLSEIFNLFGVAHRIVCDRGSSFTSKRFRDYCQGMNIKINFNATATPRANGQAERYNRTILSALSTSTDDERKWDTNVPNVQWGLNTSVNKTTGRTPYELLLGYQPRQAHDSFLSAEVCSGDDAHDRHLSRTREQARIRTQKKQAEQKARYDRTRKRTPHYSVGQLVLVRKAPSTNDGKSKKLLPKYSGPYEIKKILDADRFVVSDVSGSTRSRRPYEGVVSGDKLKSYGMTTRSDIDCSTESDE